MLNVRVLSCAGRLYDHTCQRAHRLPDHGAILINSVYVLVRDYIVRFFLAVGDGQEVDRRLFGSDGVLQPYKLLGWWKWMYHVSPFTYVVEGVLGHGTNFFVGIFDVLIEVCSAQLLAV